MQPLVGVIMGSKSDWETLSHTAQTLESLGIPHEVRVVSAHRTPDVLFDYAATARERGLRAIIAGAAREESGPTLYPAVPHLRRDTMRVGRHTCNRSSA